MMEMATDFELVDMVAKDLYEEASVGLVIKEWEGLGDEVKKVWRDAAQKSLKELDQEEQDAE